MAPKNRLRTDASSSNLSSASRSSLSECFRSKEKRECFNRNFASKCVWESRKLDFGMLQAINFLHLFILHNWGWIDFFQIQSPTYYNLVGAFYSNTKIEHDELNKTIIAIKSLLMNTSIRITLEDFGNFIHLPSKGESNEKGLYSLALYIEFRNTSELYLHDNVLHLIITWILRPIKKHVMLRSVEYYWIDFVQSDRCLDLALIMFNDINKGIGKEMSINITLPHDTYLSYIFR